MNVLPFVGVADLIETVRVWSVPFIGGCMAVLLFVLTRRAAKADARRSQATEMEHLYIGNADKLLGTLQEELRARNVRIGSLEAEREQLRSALAEERSCFEQVKHRHRDLVAFLDASGVKVPETLQA